MNKKLHETRELTANETSVREKYTSVQGQGPDQWRVQIRVDQQSFVLSGGMEKHEAEWMRDMLAIALSRMVDSEW